MVEHHRPTLTSRGWIPHWLAPQEGAIPGYGGEHVIVDASALVAIAPGEPGAEALVGTLADAPAPVLAALTAAETAIVLEQRLPGRGEVVLRGPLDRLAVTVLPFPPELWTLAHQAYARFGGGRHPAGLNVGDCRCYAAARATALPILRTGEAFARTDVEVVRV